MYLFFHHIILCNYLHYPIQKITQTISLLSASFLSCLLETFPSTLFCKYTTPTQAIRSTSIPPCFMSIDGRHPMNRKRQSPLYASIGSPVLFLFAWLISAQYLYLLGIVDFTLFSAIYLLIYSIFTPILSQYFQFGYFFFFLFF